MGMPTIAKIAEMTERKLKNKIPLLGMPLPIGP